MSEPLLVVQGLSKSFHSSKGFFARSRTNRAVDDVSFVVGKGHTFGLVGESGSGKSTIGRMLNRLISHDGGTIRFDGDDIGQIPPGALKAFRRRVQIIFQDPFASLDPRVRIGKAIAAPIRLHGLRPPAEIPARVNELLETVGLGPHHASRFPHEFSGGQRQRVAIARALAVEPELIICDEPVSALDLSIQAQVVNLLSDLQKRLGVSYVFISHDMAVVRHLATHVGVLYAGRMVETGAAGEVFDNPRHPYTRMLLEASPTPVPREAGHARAPVTGEPPNPYERPVGCAFASRCPHVIDACRAARPAADAYRNGTHLAACIRAYELAPARPLSDDVSLMSPAYRKRMEKLREARSMVR